MQASDIEVIKDIPGYKVILKAVLKSQIQQLVSTRTVNPVIVVTSIKQVTCTKQA